MMMIYKSSSFLFAASAAVWLSGALTGLQAAAAASSSPMPSSSSASVNLPPYLYNLTMESTATRNNICAQQTQFCQTAGCASAGATVNVNFCDASGTMGTACQCSTGDSKLQPWQWPVNQADCTSRNNACKMACENPTAKVADVNACQAACQSVYGNTCGQPTQTSGSYVVNKLGQTPSYDGDTSKGGGSQSGASSILTKLGGPALPFAGLATLAALAAGAGKVFMAL